MKHTILYIDDELANLNSFRIAFWMHFNILLAASTKDAEVLLENNPVQVVVTDQRMPGEAGLHFINRIHQRYPDLVFILLTGFTDMEVVIEALNAGIVYRYMLKPWEPRDMKQTLDNAVEKNQLRLQNRSLLNELQLKNKELADSNTILNQKNKQLELSRAELSAYNEELLATTNALQETNLMLTNALVRAEEGDRLKSAFLQNMSHEIRTPMNGIIGFAELLQIPNLRKEKVEYYSKIIIKSSNNLLSIVDDILEFSMIEAELVQLNETLTHINGMIANSIDTYWVESEAKGINLVFENEKNTETLYAYLDSMKITKILNSFINNALKFSNQGSISIGVRQENNELEFYVKDNGIGIDKKEHEKVFERFYQVDLSSTRTYGGTGLGLSICKGFVDIMGGKIGVESALGQGSRFYFRIPYNAVNRNTEKQTSKVAANQQEPTILVVEDESTNYLFLFEILKNHHYNMIHAFNGEEAIKKCREISTIDLVIMDVKMPVMNGYEAAEEIKKFRPQLPIIIHTAYASTEDRMRALSVGCDDYIAKPVKPANMVKIIEKHLKRNPETLK